MQQVYAKQLWGAGTTPFYSGEGSHKEHITAPYVTAVQAFLSNFDQPPMVCDLGCGDFNVGSQLVAHTAKYFAVDIVPELIAYHKQTVTDTSVTFLCQDIAKDPLPNADCALVRQVLQHLSNAEIQAILDKLSQYAYVILTEHIPNGTFTPNVDIISGQGTRLKKESGVDITAAPFEFNAKTQRELCCVAESDGLIRTVVYEV
ncbi:class I SAM-dependent methyltransferase [Dokdonia sinensis]|uniref:Class I SAM-dependent methyltransferase n=2 Tax=Dokdonia sinensis TaxID=2479847 RepID=A0A3M0GUH9_9FLAO|nr:class I SAM-dependent methyltransferase [Dokdonia sinensis]RMB60976.1 class I SAM-dependent methyltransferase [Dokdonia sinensis]